MSEKTITYSESFKLLFIEHYEKGKAAHQIFKEAGFDFDILTIGRVKNCAKRWSRAAKQLMQHHHSRLQPDAYIHSDQGAHYTRPRFQKLVKQSGLGQSISRKGNCWDNAPIESFFGHMKDENEFMSCHSFQELKNRMDAYMHYFNHDRCQWTLKKLTPINYRRQLQVA